MNLLPLSIAKIADAADKKGSTRFALSGVHLKLHPDNTFTAEATDAKQLIRVTGNCVADVFEYPAHPGLDSAPNGEVEALVPADSWRKAFAMAKKTKVKGRNMPILSSVAVQIGKEVTTFGATNLEQYPSEQSRNVEGRFPPTSDIIGQSSKNGKFLFAVDGLLLAKLLNTVSSLSEDDQPRVEFYQAEPGKPIHLKLSESEFKVDAIAMPFVPAKGADGKDIGYAAEIEKLERQVADLSDKLVAEAGIAA